MRAALIGAVMMCWPALAWAGPSEEVAARGCATLAERVDMVPGRKPVFLRSYDGAENEPALAGAAFTYDNALALVALVACGKPGHARRIGDALLDAALHDRGVVAQA